MFKILKSLVAGVVAGTALGVLFSPKKGTDIRKDLKKELKSGGSGLGTVKDTFTEMGRDMKDTLSETEAYRKGSKEVGRYAHIAKGKAKEIINENMTATQRKKAKATLAKAKNTLHKVAKKIADKT